MEESYMLDTRDRPQLLFAMIDALAAEDCRISFEGNLSQTDLAGMEGLITEENGPFKRGTLSPKLDFLIPPLTRDDVPRLERAIKSKIAFNGNRGIVHVQIARGEQIAFAASDQFADGCVVVQFGVSPELLDHLISAGALRSYQIRTRSAGSF